MTAVARTTWVLAVVLASAKAVALEHGDFLVAEPTALFHVDLETGDRRILSGGLPFHVQPIDVSVDHDGTLYIATEDEPILRVHPETGVYEEVPNTTVRGSFGVQSLAVTCLDPPRCTYHWLFFGPKWLDLPSGRLVRSTSLVTKEITDVALANGRYILMVDPGWRRVLKLDPLRSQLGSPIVTGWGIGDGPELEEPKGAVSEGPGSFFLVDSALAVVMRVELETGGREIVSGTGRGSGPALVDPHAITRDEQGMLYVTDRGLRAIVRIEPESGDREIFSADEWELGAAFEDPTGIDIGPDGDLYVADHEARAIVAVDVTTGRRRFVWKTIKGAGFPFGQISGVAHVAGQILVSDRRNSVQAVHPATGDRRILWSAPHPGEVTSVVADFDGSALVTFAEESCLLVQEWWWSCSKNEGGVVRLDPRSGEATVLFHTDGQGETAAPFRWPESVVRDGDGRLVVLGGHPKDIFVRDEEGWETIVHSSLSREPTPTHITISPGSGKPTRPFYVSGGDGKEVADRLGEDYLVVADGSEVRIRRWVANWWWLETAVSNAETGAGPPLTNPVAITTVVPEPGRWTVPWLALVAIGGQARHRRAPGSR